jgi:ketosteroid isomerase-like protein
MKRTTATIIFVLITALSVAAQNSNSSTTERQRTTNINAAPPTPPQPAKTMKPAAAATPRKATPQKPAAAPQPASDTDAVVAAFNSLLEGIRHADVAAVMNVYWNSPRLVLFNNNGSVTKTWEQVKKNRESSYPDLKDVKLEVRDLSVSMLGRDGAVISCLWTQSQTYKGTPETVSGRMTLVFKRVGTAWKAIHLHTSPESPNPASIPPSEQATPKPSPSPSPNP